MRLRPPFFSFFFFNDTATTEIYTLSLHDALPISVEEAELVRRFRLHTHAVVAGEARVAEVARVGAGRRLEEHTSELQSQSNLVCRLLLEKKKKNKHTNYILRELSAILSYYRVDAP